MEKLLCVAIEHRIVFVSFYALRAREVRAFSGTDEKKAQSVKIAAKRAEAVEKFFCGNLCGKLKPSGTNGERIGQQKKCLALEKKKEKTQKKSGLPIADR